MMKLADYSKLHKAFSAIETLDAETVWPEEASPLSPKEAIHRNFWPAGFSSGIAHAGIKTGRQDLVIIKSDQPAAAACVFTRNLCCAAPVSLSKKTFHQSPSAIQAIVCNSGNANAATGQQGLRDAEKMAGMTADAIGIEPGGVLVSSTGVIGVPLPMEKIEKAIDSLSAVMLEDSCANTAEAIMTTDTFPKFFGINVSLSGGTARLCGIAKGSGMICPDMATMLSFLVTDADIDQKLLQEMLSDANRKSFNTITVDGDTSTNDMVAILSGNGYTIKADSHDADIFYRALESLMTFFAKLIVKDGEGATKLVEIHVEGAATDSDAEKIARTVANSNLVKTAIHGEDPNWGRIIAAAGRSGAVFNPENTTIRFNDLKILEPGYRSDFSEDDAKKILGLGSFSITLTVDDGPGQAISRTCDLSKEYIEINADYRT